MKQSEGGSSFSSTRVGPGLVTGLAESTSLRARLGGYEPATSPFTASSAAHLSEAVNRHLREIC